MVSGKIKCTVSHLNSCAYLVLDSCWLSLCFFLLPCGKEQLCQEESVGTETGLLCKLSLALALLWESHGKAVPVGTAELFLWLQQSGRLADALSF